MVTKIARKLTSYSRATLSALLVITLMACADSGTKSSSGSDSGQNSAPKANISVSSDADSSELTTSTTIILDGSSSSDPDGDKLDYSWSQPSVQSISLSSTTAPTTTFTIANIGTFTFTLTVSDGALSDSTSVSLEVNSENAINQAPAFSKGLQSVDFYENDTQVVYTAVATDSDGDVLTYSISGTDSSQLTINSSSGSIRFASPPDYENPKDTGTNNIYEAQINVSDGSLSASMDLTVAVVDVSGFPVFYQGTASTSSAEGVAIANTIYTPTIIYDESGELTFSIAGTDATDFSIASSSGAISFKNTPDYESAADSGRDNVYDVELKVSDSTGSDTQELTVTVIDVNEYSVSTPSSTGSGQIAENASAGASAGIKVQASDADGTNNTVTYSFVNGATSSGLFDIDASSGTVSYNGTDSLDFESGTTSYSLNIYATSSDGSSASASFTVNVTNVNEAPSFTSSTTASTFENETGTIYTATASDPEGDNLIYSLIFDTDSNKFSIDTTSGVISFTSAPDYEAPADSNGDNTYEVQLQVTDSGNLSSDLSLRISVSNVNEAPIFTSSITTSAKENYAGVIYTAEVKDDAGDTHIYSIIGGTDQDSFNLSGAGLSFNDPPDYEASDDKKKYEVQLRVTDAQGLSADLNLSISIEDINEAPTFASPTATANVDENSESFVYTATATDVDAGDTLTYSIGGGADEGLFNLSDSTEPELTFNSPPDYETPSASGNNIYEVVVQANDAGGLTDDLTLSISVNDLNDNTPVITPNQTFSIDENSAEGSLAYILDDDGKILFDSVQATDGDANTTFKDWEILDTITDSLTINDSGQISAAANAGLDYETGAKSYTLNLTVSDGENTSNSQTVAIKISDVNEAPIIVDTTTTVSVSEASFTTDYTVYDADATDPENDTLTYSLDGDDSEFFEIDSDSGVIKFKDLPDYDKFSDANTDNNYQVTIVVSDGTYTDEHALTVELIDVDEPPVINNTITSVSVDENIGTSATVYDASATDPEGKTLTYSFAEDSDDDGNFTISENGGKVRFKDSSPNYEQPSDANTDRVYELTIKVSDGVNTTEQDVNITVDDVNEAPTANAGGDQRVNEGKQVTLSARASDPDEGDELTYNWQEVDSVGNAAYSPLVSLESSDTATTAFTSPTNILTDTAITFQLTVTDSGNNTATDTVVITVNNSPTANAGSAQRVDEGDEVTLTGSASDTDDGTITSYSWVEVKDDGAGNLVEVSPGTVTLADSTATDENKEVTTSFTAPEIVADSNNRGAITLTFQLTVTDNDGAKDQSVVTVEVENLPVIDKVYLQDDDSAYGIGDTATVYIQAGKSETSLKLQAFSNFNGGTLTGFTEIGQGLYSAKYSVMSSHYSVAAGGTVTTSIVLTDGYGHVSAGYVSVTLDDSEYIDTVPPSQKISAIDISHDTGTSDDDFITNTPAQTLTAELNASLEDGDILYGSVATDNDGNPVWLDVSGSISTQDGKTISWSTTLSSVAESIIQFKVVDAAGNDGQVATQAYTLDTEKPAQTISAIALSDDTGTKSNDFITNIAAQTISAALSAALATGDILYGSVGSDDNGDIVWVNITESISELDGTSIITWNEVELKEGVHKLILRITDIADNNTTFEQEYTLDQTPPDIQFSAVSFSADTGTKPDDFITNSDKQTISATLSAALATGDILYGSVGSDDNGDIVWVNITESISELDGTSIITWNEVELKEGVHKLILRITDIADNNTTFEQEYTLDQTPPDIQFSAVSFSADTGTKPDDFITNSDKQTISANLSAALATGDILYGAVGSDESGALDWEDITESVSSVNGTTTISWDEVDLVLGTHDLIFRITDIADNNTTFKQEYTLDQTAPAIEFSAVSFSVDTGTESDDFITNYNKQTISANLSAALATGDILYGAVGSDESGALDWEDITESVSSVNGTTTISWDEVDLVLGTHDLIFRITDIADNNTTFKQEYTLDQTAPAIEFSAVSFSVDTGTESDDFITNYNKQTISANLSAALATGDILYGAVGSDESGALDWEDITESVSSVNGTTTISWDEVDLVLGTHDLIFRITDIADNNTTFDKKYTLDQTPPDIVISNIAFSDDTGTESDDLITNIATQTISATLDVDLDTDGGDILYGSVSSDNSGLIWTDITAKISTSNDGSISITWDGVELSTGTHDLIFRITDIADNNTTFDKKYTLDQTPPDIVISNIAFSDDTGTESDDLITNIATQTISATLDVDLDTDGGDILYGSVSSDNSGLIWTDITAKISTSNDGSISITWDGVELSTGTHDLIFRITDIADNNTTFDKKYTLDQTPPDIVISNIAFSDDTGTESDDLITNIATQTISATLDVDLDTDGGDILYGSVSSDNSGLIWTDITAKISTSNDGSISITWDGVELSTGTHDLIFRITDIADNNTTFDKKYTLDQTPPDIVISNIAFSDDTGTESDDLITNKATQTISATLDVDLDTDGGDILYGSVSSDNSGLIWTDITAKISTSNDGSISITWDGVELSTGTHDLIFRITDIADNNTTFDKKYTLDQTPPDIVISNIAFSDDTGTESDDLITNIATQTISATLDVDLDTDGGDILYGSVSSDNSGLIWTDITAKISTSNDGSISITWDGVELSTGTHDLIFRITDIADNNTTFDKKYTLDQTPPDIVISNIAFSDDTGTESDDLITNKATQTISATLDVDLDTDGGDILYGSVSSDNSGLIWTDITAKISTSNDGSISITWDGVELSTGTHDLIFRITDIADNNTTFDKKYTLDQTPPDIVISNIAFSDDTGTESDDLITNKATQTISATLDVDLDTDGGDILYGSVSSDNSGLIWTDITAKISTSNDGSISITWDGVELSTGTHDLIFRITDIADNNTTFDKKYTLDQTPPDIVISNIAFSDDTGTESDDLITNIATQTISATLDVDLDTDGGDILYGSVSSDNSGLIWTDITAKISTSNDGSISITWDGVELSTGTHDLIFRITDIADNNTTFDKKYTLDQTPPDIVISNIAFSDDTGTESDDLITNIATQTISATLDVDLDTDGGDILYGSVSSDNSGLIWTDITAKISTSNDGSISITWDGVELSTGTHDLIFRITDIADNNTTFDKKYTLDQTPPDIVISNIAFSDDTGTESDDLITNIATQTISATLDVDLDTDGGDILYGSVSSDNSGLIWTDITAKISTSNDGSISITWDGVELSTGTHDLIFRITDIADNNTTFDKKYTLDQTPPDIVISNIAFSDDTGTESDDLITNKATQTISATLDVDLDTDGGDILYGSVSSDNSGLIWTDITAKISTSNDGSISITWDGVELSTGTHDLIFRITDIADNNTTFDKKYTLDQTPPDIVISNIAFSDDTGTESDDLITNIATQTISATLDVDLDTDGGDILYGSVSSDNSGLIWTDITAKISTSNDGSISITWDGVELSTGTHDLIFRITDIADNNTTFDKKYTLDQTPPDIVISNIAFSDDTGTESDDLITNIATQTISATLDVDLDTDGGDILYGSVSSDNSGLIWTDITAKISTSNDGSISITWDGVELSTGTHDLIFRITDIADNNTTFDKKYTLDQTPPDIVISNIAFSDDTGTESDDLITNIATQTISATLDVDLDTDGGDILYGSVSSDNSGLIWTDITAKISTSNDGSISITWDGVELSTGTHDLIFRITDIADNNTTFKQEYTLDQTAPTIEFSAVSFSVDTGTESDDFITNYNKQTISANLSAALATGDILYGAVGSDESGALDWEDITESVSSVNGTTTISWDEVDLVLGTHDLIFRITDIADNNTTFEQEYTLDQTAPAIEFSAVSFSVDTGTESDDFITNYNKQTISANLSAALATGDILYGAVGSDESGALDWEDITESVSSVNGTTTISWDEVDLVLGTHDLIFRITDIADNNTTFKQEYTLDQTAPEIEISDIALSSDTGTKSNDLITKIDTQTISANLSAALDTDGGDTLHGSLDSGSSWTDITGKISDSTKITWNEVTLETGSHDLIFRITDIADNNTTVSLEYTLDQTPPGIDTSGTASEVSEAFDAALDASDSSDDGSGIASYVWQQVAADGSAWADNSTALVITNSNSATTSASTPGIADDDGADLSFYFAVTIIDIAGNSATSSALPLTVTNAYKTPDITANAGTAPDFNQLSLSWTATSGLTYKLHRSSNSDCDDLSTTTNCSNYYAALDLSSGGQITQIDSDLGLFSSYYYWLEAQLNGEIVSLSSAPLEANTTGPVLNDTGVVQGADYPNGFDSHNGSNAVCDGGYLVDDQGAAIDATSTYTGTTTFIAFANEDCELGRDSTHNDDSDGHAGFSYTRLNSDGSEYTGNGVYSEEAWSCVLDNVTGLIWEVKTTDGTLRDKDKTFTWYDSDNSTFKGTQSDQDTDDLITYVNGDSSVNNGSGLCGLTNWRLPTATEMVSLRNNSIVVGNSNFSVDSNYFPNLSYVYYWTSSVNYFANADGDNDSTTYPIWNHGAEDMVSSSSNGSSSDLRYAILVSSSSTSANDYFNDWSDDRYEIHNDGTVSDKRTGLMWMRCGYDDEFAFYDSAADTCVAANDDNHGAAAYPDALGREIQLANKEISNGHNNDNNNIGSYTDWRLPNLTELFSLRDHTAYDADEDKALINPQAFPNAETTSYWTSTPRAISTGGSVYLVSFSPTATSAFSFSGMNNTYKLRLVRDDIKTPRILTLNINGDNIVNASDSSNLGTIPVSGSTGDVESGQPLTLKIGSISTEIEVSNGSFATTINLFTLGDGTYTVTADVSDQAGKAANQFTSSLLVDTVAPPTINNSVSATPGTYAIGASVALTLTTASFSESGLSLTSNSFNGQSLGEVTYKDGTYTTTYTVVENDTDIAAGGTVITDLAFIDPAGNVGPTTGSITLTGASIDANRPTIASVSVEAGIHGIGDSVAITITAGANETGLDLTSTTFNGATLSASTDNNDGTYTTTYTVGENDPDVAAGGSVSVNLAFTDPAGNAGTALGTVILPAGTSIDTSPPNQTISEIDINDDSGASTTDFLTKESDQTITATLSAGLETGDTLHGSVNSGANWEDITASVSDTTITWNSVTLSSGAIQFKVVDAAGNDGAVAEQVYTLDQTAPTIASITVGESDKLYKVGDSIAVTITANNAETGLNFSTRTLNGYDLDNGVEADADGVSDNANGTYTTTYTVVNGHTDVSKEATITIKLTFTDLAGNESTTTETVNLPSGTSIDANTPSINSISVAAGNHGIGQAVTITITADESDLLLRGHGDETSDHGKFNGQKLTDFAYSGAADGAYTYTATYTVKDDDDSIADGGDVTVDIALVDPSENISDADTIVKLSGASIDANAPTITSEAGISVNENAAATVYTALATDPETDSNSFNYTTSDSNTLSYALSGTDAAQLSIDSASGAISFVSPPDHENPTDASTGAEGSVDPADTNNTYQLTLEVSDPAGNAATQELTITVTDLNDVAPVIDSGQTLSIIETSAVDGTVGTVAVIDPDTANTFTWSITDTDTGDSTHTTSENPSAYFAINSSTGQITVKQKLTENVDGDASYNVTLNLQVNDGATDSAVAQVTITVQEAILPDDFNATGVGAALVKLTWTAATDSDSYSNNYNIYRSSDETCDLANYSTACNNSDLFTSKTPLFTDIVPVPSITYYYWIEAIRTFSDDSETMTQTSATPISATPEPRLNDTGIYWNAANNGGNNSDCVSNTNIDAPQDCDYGLDANTTVADDADGHAGFSFTKLGSDGYPLSANASSWSCVQDNVTGLIWEVKTDGGNGDDIGGDLHDKDDTYNWYNTNSETNGGSDGYADYDGAICYGYGSANSTTFCNTEAFVARVNSAGLCGAHDWRLPHINEIRSISNYAFSNAASGARLPGIDTSYFPNTQMHVNNKVVSYWSASPSVSASEKAWTHNYYFDTMSEKEYTEALYIRLVRGGQ